MKIRYCLKQLTLLNKLKFLQGHYQLDKNENTNYDEYDMT